MSELYKAGNYNSYKSMGFSGCDISATIRLPSYARFDGNGNLNSNVVFQIGTLQTISISTYNAKTPVKAIGYKNPIAVARGGRTIAGTMIFNQLHTHVFNDSADSLTKVVEDKEGFLTYSSGDAVYLLSHPLGSRGERLPHNKLQWDFSWDTSLVGERMKPSDLPPFDIIINFLNENGNTGKIIIYGVELVHDSQTLSVEDIYTEAQYQYIARDIEYFSIAGTREDALKAYDGVYNQIVDKNTQEQIAKFLDAEQKQAEKNIQVGTGIGLENTLDSAFREGKLNATAGEALRDRYVQAQADLKAAEAAYKALPPGGIDPHSMDDLRNSREKVRRTKEALEDPMNRDFGLWNKEYLLDARKRREAMGPSAAVRTVRLARPIKGPP